MNFFKAVKIAEANQHLIGKEWNGATIDEVIIAPTDPLLWAYFKRSYFQSLNAQQSVVPFMNSNVDVYVVCNKKQIRTLNLFVYTPIYNLPENLNVIY